MPKYKWATAHEWLEHHVRNMSENEVRGMLLNLSRLVDSDTIQELWQDQMDADGYFDNLEWLHTDDLQWVRKIHEDVFHVLNVVILPDDTHALFDGEIDLSDYSEEDMDQEVKGYYRNIAEVQSEYKDAWKQIVAEIIAEQSTEFCGRFDSEVDLLTHLKERYGVEKEHLS